MKPTLNFFLASSLPVGQNAVKNILFRASTIALHFVIYRFLSLLAFKSRDYTSFLMFAEDVAQKVRYIVSRGFSGKALLVLAFAILTASAGFYDTLLWSLDFPGYVTKVKIVSAGELSSSMVESPSYITFLANPSNDLSRIDINASFTANLYATGLNFSLPGIIDHGHPVTVTPSANLSSSSPRIWLDSEGFAVGIDESIMITPTMNATDGSFCPTRTVDQTTQVWNCAIRSSDALTLINQVMGRPLVVWDRSTSPEHSEYIRPERRDNPWVSLGAGGGTSAMKQLFTVTKGTSKHTFMQTTFKTTMVSFSPTRLDNTDLTDLVRRTWSTDPGQPMTPVVQSLADIVVKGNNNQTSLTFGSFVQDKNSVASASTELLHVLTNDINGIPTPYYSFFRFASTNITLIRSEVTFNPPSHITPPGCNSPYSYSSTGGVLRTINCAITDRNVSGAHFFGQIDASSVVIMSDVLGDIRADNSADALKEAGILWYNANTDYIDKLVESRGLILSGNRADVQVAVSTNEVAISYLQLVLTLLPLVLALGAVLLTFQKHMSYFRNSFLSAILTTTHATGELDCATVGSAGATPEILLKRMGDHIVVGTAGGDFRLTPVLNQQLGHGIAYEPLIMEKDHDHTKYVVSP